MSFSIQGFWCHCVEFGWPLPGAQDGCRSPTVVPQLCGWVPYILYLKCVPSFPVYVWSTAQKGKSVVASILFMLVHWGDEFGKGFQLMSFEFNQDIIHISDLMTRGVCPWKAFGLSFWPPACTEQPQKGGISFGWTHGASVFLPKKNNKNVQVLETSNGETSQV